MDSNSTVEKLLEKAAQKTKAQEIAKEQVEEWQLVLNRIFSSPDGQYFGKRFINLLGVFSVDASANGINLVEAKARREVYLRLIRPYLDKTIRMEIE